MSPLGLLLACGLPAAQGLPIPPPTDPAQISRLASPNAPERFSPAPNVVTSSYAVPAARLFLLGQAVAGSRPRTYQAALYVGHRQVHDVARRAALNFPDLIMVQVRDEDLGRSNPILFSRSLYGHGDFA
jgi:hypothetical protein